MSSIHSLRRPIASRSRRPSPAAAALRAAAWAWALLSRALNSEPRPKWTSLNAHLLADISESTATAAREALRDPLYAPLGSVGDRAQDNRHALPACRKSPLG